MLITKNVDELIKQQMTPLGVLSTGEIFGIEYQERAGNMQLLGKIGQGKTVFLETIIISDLRNNKGGLLIDPYGTIVNNVLEYITPEQKDNVIIFEAENSDLETNIKKFDENIDINNFVKDGQKFLLCKINSHKINEDIVRELGLYIIKKFYKTNPISCSLIIDEAHNFMNNETIENVLQNKEHKINCILSDQEVSCYSNDILDRILDSMEHIVCYQTDKQTAEVIAQKTQFGISVENIIGLDKYHFYMKLMINSKAPYSATTNGVVFPIPYDKIGHKK